MAVVDIVVVVVEDDKDEVVVWCYKRRSEQDLWDGWSSRSFVGRDERKPTKQTRLNYKATQWTVRKVKSEQSSGHQVIVASRVT